MDEVLPKEPQNYDEKEKLFDCTDFDIPSVFDTLSA